MASSGAPSVRVHSASLFELPTSDVFSAPPDGELDRRRRDPRIEVARREAVFRRALAVADIVAVAAAMLLAVVLAGGDALRPAALLAPAVVLAAGKLAGVYDRDELLINRT